MSQIINKIVCLGDSITANSETASYVDEWQKLAPLVTIVGAGVNGETATDGLSRLQNDVLVHKPDLVVVVFGHNEVHRGIPTEVYKQSLEALVTQVMDRGALVWLMTPTQIADAKMALLYVPYLKILSQVAEKYSIKLVDMWQVFDPTPLDQIFTYMFEDNGWTGQDYLHPNKLGHQLIARKLHQELVSHNF